MAFSSAPGEGLDPEALRRVTGRAFGEVELAVVRHGGSIETVAGDALTAIFGLPMVHEDDALRGVRAAAEARDALSILAAELAIEQALDLDFRIGISTGEVVTVIDAGPQLRTTGEPLRLSSRLGQAAKPGEILFDERSRQLLRDSVLAEPANEGWRLLAVATRARVSPDGLCRRWSAASVSAGDSTTPSNRRWAIAPASSSPCSASPASGNRVWCKNSSTVSPGRRSSPAAAASPTERASPTGRCSRPSMRQSDSKTPTHPTKRERSSSARSARSPKLSLLLTG